MPTAFLTGGTGFVGGHVARALVDHGWRVRLLARNTARAPGLLLEGLPVETIAGDLSEAGIPESALAGVDAVIHVAGLTKARTLEDYREVNVRGTGRLLAAAGRAAPDAVFLIVSSLAAAGPAREGRPVSDADPSRPVSWYGISKLEGEAAVARNWKGPWISVRPAVVYGPGDRGLFEYFRMAARGWVPVPVRQARVQILGVDQVSLAIARAAARRDLGGATRFLCDPEPVRLGELAGLIARLPPRPARLIGIPNGAVRLLGLVETAVETISGRSRPFNSDKATEILAGDWLCDSAPLRRELNLPAPVPLAEGLRATWDWYLGAGWLRGKAL
jgi:nucleoside-diphosphate-sugar epimerase